jgi:hypothetical protein
MNSKEREQLMLAFINVSKGEDAIGGPYAVAAALLELARVLDQIDTSLGYLTELSVKLQRAGK